MADRDNRLGRASSLSLPANRSDKLGRTDLDDLFQVSLSKRSKLDLGVSGIRRGANFDVELYRFKVPVSQIPSRVRNTDFRKLRNADRSRYLELAGSSRSGGNRNESLSLAEAAEGNYLVRLLRRAGDSRYRLAITATELPIDPKPPDPKPPVTDPPGSEGNSFDRPINANLPFSISGTISDTDKEDYYRVTSTGSDYLLDLSGLSADANLEIYNANRTLIRTSINAGTANERFIQPLAAGTYFFKVSQAAAGNQTNYSLGATALVDNYAGKYTDAASLATATSLNLSATPQVLSNYVVEQGVSSPEDFFKFTVSTPTAFLSLELQNMPLGDLGVQIFQETETPQQGLTLNKVRNPNGSYPNELYAGKLTQGTYYIRILPGSTITPGSPTEGSTYDLSLTLSDKTGIPTIVRDIKFGAEASNPGNVTAVGNFAYFSASDENGSALWRTDGTLDGTKKIRNFSSITSEKFAVVGSGAAANVYFVADDGVTGSELWTTDGTTARQVADFQTNGTASSDPKQLMALGDRLYFTAKTANQITNLYRTANSAGTAVELVARASEIVTNPDGTASAAPVVANLSTTEMIADNATGTLYFTGRLQIGAGAGATSSGNELLSVTNNNVFGLTDFQPGSDSSSLRNLTLIGNKLFATAFVGGSFDPRLIRVDGFGTSPNYTIVQQGADTLTVDGKLQYTLTANGTLYFTAANASQGKEIFKLDNALTVVGTGTGAGKTVDATLLKDVQLGTSVGSEPFNLLSIGNEIYFFADDGEAGRELWKSDGTDAGTVLVRNNGGSPRGSIADNASMVLFQNTLYFAADNEVDGRQVWTYDPAAPANSQLKQIIINRIPGQGAEGSSPIQFTVAGSNLFFNATDGLSGEELWSI
ncbi:hypothetical protein IFO70_08330 [Phormidium tenue FACHB-886]|nr:hypothetical protein [Phormidium tenue FACHB-886]